MSADDTAGHAASPAVAAEAQSREADVLEGPVSPSPRPGRYRLGDGIHRAGQMQPYRRRPDDPIYRRLAIFTSDPAESRLTGRVSEVPVPYEPLAPGPTGSIFEVIGVDGVTGQSYRRAELDQRDVLLRGGYAPTTTDPRFHQPGDLLGRGVLLRPQLVVDVQLKAGPLDLQVPAAARRQHRQPLPVLPPLVQVGVPLQGADRRIEADRAQLLLDHLVGDVVERHLDVGVIRHEAVEEVLDDLALHAIRIANVEPITRQRCYSDRFEHLVDLRLP